MAARLPVKMAAVGCMDKEPDGCPAAGRLLLSSGWAQDGCHRLYRSQARWPLLVAWIRSKMAALQQGGCCWAQDGCQDGCYRFYRSRVRWLLCQAARCLLLSIGWV